MFKKKKVPKAPEETIKKRTPKEVRFASSYRVKEFYTDERVVEFSPYTTDAHWDKKIEELRAKLALGEEIIRRKDRQSKLKSSTSR